MNLMSRMLNSNEQFELNDTFQLEFHMHASPQGGGNGRDCKPSHQASTKFCFKKRCIVKIIKDAENMCWAQAIVTAKAIADNHPNHRGLRRGRQIQQDAALLSHAEANVEPAPAE